MTAVSSDTSSDSQENQLLRQRSHSYRLHYINEEMYVINYDYI